MAKKKQGFIKHYFVGPVRNIGKAFSFIPQILPFIRERKIEFDVWSVDARKRLNNPSMSNFNLGVGFYNENKVGDAIIRFKLSSYMNPKFADSFMWIGKSYLLKNNLNKAASFFIKAKKLNCKSEEFLYFYNIYVEKNFSYSANVKISKDFFAKFVLMMNEYFVENYAYKGAENIAKLFSAEVKLDNPVVLELGCGSGILANIIKHKNNNISLDGLDYCKDAIALCKDLKMSENNRLDNEEKQQTINLNAADNQHKKTNFIYDKLHKVDVVDLKLDNNIKYDVIIARGIFNYVIDIEAALKNIAKYAKKGTLLLFNLNDAATDEQIKNNIANYSFPFYLNNKLTSLTEMKNLCKKHGFEFSKEDKFTLDNQGNKAASLIFKFK
jgi:predicted TPR repeat methyltransferase